MMTSTYWSAGLVHFLAQLSASRESIGALTPRIILRILTGMVQSMNLCEGQNLDLCLNFIMTVGPFLESKELDFVDQFGEILRNLKEQVNGKGTASTMAVCWLLMLRERGWKTDEFGY